MNPKKWLRQNPSLVKEKLSLQGFTFDDKAYLELEQNRKSLQTHVQNLQAERNSKSKQVGHLKRSGECTDALMDELAHLGHELKSTEQALLALQNTMHGIEMSLPNIAHESVPDGHSDKDNVCIKTVGIPPSFNFTPKDHVTLAEDLGVLDMALAANMSGARFAMMQSKLAKLHRVLANWMLDLHITQHGYMEVNPPFMVSKESLYNSGQLPKMQDDLFFEASGNAALIPTAEVPLVNLVANRILESKTLPLKLVAHTPCFRKEAGSYGKDTRGLIRMHQFEKVELVQIVKPEDSYAAHEAICEHSQTILQQLKLPYRVMNLCRGDLGFCAAKTYDLEVWLPSQNCYREIASISNCEGFQARRMSARMRTEDKQIEAVHTLNGSGLAVSRTLVAILENYQQADGSIIMPEVLHKKLGFEKI